ncbi:MAG: hypothetical protein A2508_01120 [Candidatus Lambdaproteobacteria bacterium RIFOXYD12_FULL_49_8]|nr:MAG: hypothetical protein A2508_01120 [Candidatus Lambdaproteobacteria bacterium RIFOXYD12_FULL_49_8]
MKPPFGNPAMGYFISEETLFLGQTFTLSGEEAQHLLGARRIRLGEKIEIQDPKEQRFLCEILELGRKSLELKTLIQLTPPAEPAFSIHLWQAMVKEKAADYILQKATELGAYELVFFQSQYAARLPEPREEAHKVERWQKIALEACKQSGRVRPPFIRLERQAPWETLVQGPSLMLHPGGNFDLTQPAWGKEANSLNLLIGPEGGFSEEEAQTYGGPRLHLGPRILRADTAALAALTLLGHHFGDLG